VGGKQVCLRVETAQVAAEEGAVGAANHTDAWAVHGAEFAVLEEPKGRKGCDARLIDRGVLRKAECARNSLHRARRIVNVVVESMLNRPISQPT
jgi:hypothetical protein